jgi:hypothetical protein
MNLTEALAVCCNFFKFSLMGPMATKHQNVAIFSLYVSYLP